jgi:hypothetical protein
MKCALFAATLLTLVSSISIAVSAFAAELQTEDFSSAKFDRPTVIDNEWMPLKPGTRWTWEGTTVDEEGATEPHTVIFTVTDLSKEIDGVRTIVCWDRDYADGELEETEIVFFAQDNDRNVWHLGQYPEEYEDGEFAAAPTWIHGVNDGKAGIMMKAAPVLGSPSYSQGLSLSTNWTDRAQVFQMGEKTTVPFGTFEDVLVMQEWDQEEPDSRQLKFYAPGIGNVRVGWRAEKDTDQEVLELVKFEQLDEKELAKARERVLKLEAHGFEVSKDVYAKTKPIVRLDVAELAGEAKTRLLADDLQAVEEAAAKE